MKGTSRQRSILHVDLDPFFVSVERSLDVSLRGRPLVVGGAAGSSGVVAAASAEARQAGVRPGQSLVAARRLCPTACFRPGDLDAYARVSEQVTAILLAASRRVERPSADEAYADLTPESPGSPHPAAAAEGVKDEIQRRIGLDASLGLAGSRLAARVASGLARPRGLLVVLPGYEMSFLARQSVDVLPDLPPHLQTALRRAGLDTLGQLLAGEPAALEKAVGTAVAERLRAVAAGEDEEPVAVAAPPAWIQEEATLRAVRPDRTTLEGLLESLGARACRRLRPFGLRAGTVTVDVRRGERSQRRSESVQPGIADEATACGVVHALADPLLDPAGTVTALQVRLSRLSRPYPQAPLFPELGVASG